MAKRFVVALLLLLVFLVLAAQAINGDDGNGCTYGTETCGDPGWQNYPPY